MDDSDTWEARLFNRCKQKMKSYLSREWHNPRQEGREGQGFRDGEKIEDTCVNLVGVDDFGASQVVLVVKNPPANAGDRDAGSTPGLGRSPGGGNGNSLQYLSLKNPTDRGA